MLLEMQCPHYSMCSKMVAQRTSFLTLLVISVQNIKCIEQYCVLSVGINHLFYIADVVGHPYYSLEGNIARQVLELLHTLFIIMH